MCKLQKTLTVNIKRFIHYNSIKIYLYSVGSKIPAITLVLKYFTAYNENSLKNSHFLIFTYPLYLYNKLPLLAGSNCTYTTSCRKLHERIVPVQQAAASCRNKLYLYNKPPQVAGRFCTCTTGCRNLIYTVVMLQRCAFLINNGNFLKKMRFPCL